MDSITKNLVKVGRISSINPERCTARVVFEAQGVVSHDLRLIVPQSLKNKDYFMPDIGESVVCIFLPTGNAEGFVLGAIYTDGNTPPATSADKRVLSFEDGTVIEYDRKNSELTLNIEGPINVKARGINVTGELTVDGISFQTHTHKENGAGANTDPPQ